MFLSERSKKLIKKRLKNSRRSNDYIDMDNTENVIQWPEMKNKIEDLRSKNPIIAKECFPTIDNVIRINPEFVQTFCSYIKKYIFKTTSEEINYKNLIFCDGATPVLEFLSFILCDEGDKFVIPSPMFSGFGGYFGDRIIPAKKKFDEKNMEFNLDFDVIEEKIKLDGVKGLVICNPNNPCGTSYSESDLRKVIDLVLENNIHLIVDEVYAQSMHLDEHGGVYKFISMYEIVINEPDEKKKEKMEQHIHMVYSVSKDFGIAGFRIGTLFTKNEDILSVFRNIDYHQMSSSDTIFYANLLFKDQSFISSFIYNNYKIITDRFSKVFEYLETIPHIKYSTKTKSGLFIFVKFDLITSYEQEEKFYETLLNDKKVLISKGKDFFAPCPGFFRIVITSHDEETVMQSLKLIFETYISMFVKKKESKLSNFTIDVNLKYENSTGKVDLKFNDIGVKKAIKLMSYLNQSE